MDLNALEKLGFAVQRYGGGHNKALPRAGSIQKCLMCAKPFQMLFYVGDVDQICPECFVTYKDCAKIACRKCKEVVARINPGKIPSGFVIRPGDHLHTDKCGICHTDLTDKVWSSTVEEISEWERRNGRGRIILPMRQ